MSNFSDKKNNMRYILLKKYMFIHVSMNLSMSAHFKKYTIVLWNIEEVIISTADMLSYLISNLLGLISDINVPQDDIKNEYFWNLIYHIVQTMKYFLVV